ncbi:MAG: hypothetical protein U1A78_35380 [Polyangia bacterium]
MSNRVGDNTPAKSEIEKLEKAVEDLIGKLSAFCVTLLPDERQGLTRPRLGIEPFLSRMAGVARKLGLALSGFSPDGLLADLRTAQDLARLETLLDKALQLVRDTRAQARSEAAEAGLLYYGLAQTAADRVPEIEVDVREMRAFMANGPRRRPEAPHDPEGR